MKKRTSLAIALLFIFVFSCNDDSDYVTLDKNYLEIIINGEKFTKYANSGSGYGIYDEGNFHEICDNKPGFFHGVTHIETSNFTIWVSLYHYNNSSDFENSQVGTYNISTDSSFCNLDASVTLWDKTEPNMLTQLLPGASNKVNQITNLGQDNMSTYVVGGVKYKITGELSSMTFINDSDEEFTVSGKYEAYFTLINQ